MRHYPPTYTLLSHTGHCPSRALTSPFRVSAFAAAFARPVYSRLLSLHSKTHFDRFATRVCIHTYIHTLSLSLFLSFADLEQSLERESRVTDRVFKGRVAVWSLKRKNVAIKVQHQLKHITPPFVSLSFSLSLSLSLSLSFFLYLSLSQ